MGGQEGRPPEDDSVLAPKRLAPPPASASERAEREAIGKLRSRGSPPLDKELPTAELVLPSFYDRSLLPPLPFAESSIAILGTATDYQPFLSSDKGSIYTEITVKVEEVFQADPGFSVSRGDSLTINRPDGSVQLPDGRIVTRVAKGLGTPLQPKCTYVLFLSRSPMVPPRYVVAVAWELRDGRVLPADVRCGPEEQAELTTLSAEQFLQRVRSESRRAK